MQIKESRLLTDKCEIMLYLQFDKQQFSSVKLLVLPFIFQLISIKKGKTYCRYLLKCQHYGKSSFLNCFCLFSFFRSTITSIQSPWRQWRFQRAKSSWKYFPLVCWSLLNHFTLVTSVCISWENIFKFFLEKHTSCLTIKLILVFICSFWASNRNKYSINMMQHWYKTSYCYHMTNIPICILVINV